MLKFQKKTGYEVFCKDFSSGYINSSKFGRIKINQDLWESGDKNDRSWVWFLQSFVFLDELIDAGDVSLLGSIIKSWVLKYQNTKVDSEFPWHDHASALRLDRISRVKIEYNLENLDILAVKHAEFLMDDSFYSKNTNHGFDQACSLILASIAFNNSEGADKWLETGVSRLINEIKFAFSSDGVHVENSPAYHNGMIKNFIRAHRLLKEVNVVVEDIDPLFDKALNFLAWSTRPDGYLPYIGDSEKYKPSLPNEFNYLNGYKNLKYVLSREGDCELSKEKYSIFEKSGYAFYRSSWLDWDNHVHIIMKSGFLSNYHRQDDDLNILIYAFGEDWLIDSGMFNHNKKDPIRKYMRSNLAHNVPIVSNCEVLRKNDRPDFCTLRLIEDFSSELSLEGSTKMYKGGEVKRRVFVKNSLNYKIVDTFDGFGENEKYCIFHFPIEKEITIYNDFVVVRGRNKKMVFKNSLGTLCKTSSGFCGDFPSVCSKNVNKIEDSQVLCFGPFFENSIEFDIHFMDF